MAFSVVPRCRAFCSLHYGTMIVGYEVLATVCLLFDMADSNQDAQCKRIRLGVYISVQLLMRALFVELVDVGSTCSCRCGCLTTQLG